MLLLQNWIWLRWHHICFFLVWSVCKQDCRDLSHIHAGTLSLCKWYWCDYFCNHSGIGINDFLNYNIKQMNYHHCQSRQPQRYDLGKKNGTPFGGHILVKSKPILKNYIRFGIGIEKEFFTIWDFAPLCSFICLEASYVSPSRNQRIFSFEKSINFYEQYLAQISTDFLKQGLKPQFNFLQSETLHNSVALFV